MTTPPVPDDRRPSTYSPATGAQWVIGHGSQRAVVTEVGATLRSFTKDDEPILAGFEMDEWSHGGRGQILAPWPNRLGDGRYAYGDIEAQVPWNEIPRRNAIHGLVRWLPWEMVSRAQNQVTLATCLYPSPGYPFTLALSVEYRLARDGLTVETRAENRGDATLPFGLGFHPYFTVGTHLVNDALLTVPASTTLVTDERGLPTGQESVVGTPKDFRAAKPVGSQVLDTGFAELDRGDNSRAEIHLVHPDDGHGLTLWMDEAFKYVMVFTGDTLPANEQRRSIALEPMTCPPDAFRSEIDLVALAPGATWVGTWGITPVAAQDA